MLYDCTTRLSLQRIRSPRVHLVCNRVFFSSGGSLACASRRRRAWLASAAVGLDQGPLLPRPHWLAGRRLGRDRLEDGAQGIDAQLLLGPVVPAGFLGAPIRVI